MAIQIDMMMIRIQMMRCRSTFSLSHIQALRVVTAENAEKPIAAPTLPSPVEPYRKAPRAIISRKDCNITNLRTGPLGQFLCICLTCSQPMSSKTLTKAAIRFRKSEWIGPRKATASWAKKNLNATHPPVPSPSKAVVLSQTGL